MYEFRNLALIESIPVNRLLADCAIHQRLVRLLHEVENDGAFAETNIFIADFRWSAAPRLPASNGAANEAWLPARVTAFHRDVVPPPGDVRIHQEIRGLSVA